MAHFPSLFPNTLAEQNQTSNATPMQTKAQGLFPQQASNFGAQQQQQQSYPQQMPNNGSNNPFYNSNWYGNVGGQAAANTGYGLLTQNILDQIRACAQSATPIFILPSSSLASPPSNSVPGCQQVCPPTCIPYPMPMAIYPPYAQQQNSSDRECKCNSNGSRGSRNDNLDNWDRDCGFAIKNEINNQQQQYNQQNESWSKHQCQETTDGTICARKNCPVTIQLQAMISQMLGVQGIVPAAITRILLRHVGGSNVRDSLEDVMARATRCLRQMTKDQLVRESKSCGEVHTLLGLFLTSQSTIPRLIPILTTTQLKSNILKALIDSLINAKIMENQAGGAEAPEALDSLLLELKSDDELRELLAALREKECEERVNVSFASNNPQRIIAESRLCNVQRKIQQLEREMQRRRDSRECGDWNRNVGVLQRHSSPVPLPQRYDSPDPFVSYRVASPKRLLLKPHVGSPETTYRKPVEGSTCGEEKKPEKTTTTPKDVQKDSKETNASECQCQIDDDCKREDGEDGDNTNEDNKTDCDDYEDNEK